MATKTQLLTALQTTRPKLEEESDADYIARLKEEVQPRLDRMRARRQEQLDSIPANAIDALKAEALQILADQAEADYKEANADSAL